MVNAFNLTMSHPPDPHDADRQPRAEDGTDPSPTKAPSGESGAAPGDAVGVSLMITRRQRAQLRDLGFSDETIGAMTPLEAHRHLGLGL